MDREVGTPAVAEEDELARRRRKHWDESLQRPVQRFPATTLAEVLADVLVAADEGDESFDVTQFLAAEGHTDETIDTLRSYLSLEQPDASADAAPSCTVIEWPQGDGRVRMLARIRAMLLDD